MPCINNTLLPSNTLYPGICGTTVYPIQIAATLGTEFNIATDEKTEFNIATDEKTEFNITITNKGGG